MTHRLIRRLLGAIPQKHLGHIHRVAEGADPIPEGAISTANCGYVETLHEDAVWAAIQPMCPKCVNSLIDELGFMGTELALHAEMLAAGSRIYERKFPRATVIKP